MPSFIIDSDLVYHYEPLESIAYESKTAIDEFLRTNCEFWYPGDTHGVFWLSNTNGEVYCILTALESSLDGQPIIEIYNVCASKSHRRKGYTKKLLQIFQHQYPNIPIWLAVVFGNKPAFDLYVSLGFTNPKITRYPPSGGEYPEDIISLMYTGDISKTDQNFTMATIKFMHKRINKKL